MEKTPDWVNAIYLQIVKNEFERIKLELIMHGANPEEVEKIDITTEEQTEKIASVEEMRLFGVGGDGSRRRRKR